MKIALVGIAGKTGSQIALEAKKRGHVVAGISCRAASAAGEMASFPIVIADASGHSRISYGDYADAYVSEIETGRYLKETAIATY